MTASLSTKTRVQYRKVIDQFHAFQQKHHPSMDLLPINTGVAIQYVTHIHLLGQSSSSVMSSVSALNYINKICGGKDLYDCFCFSRLIKGIRAVNPSRDTRLPITPDLLDKLCKAVHDIYTDKYECALLRAMMLLAFYGFLRIGEITCESSSAQNKNLLHLSHIDVDTVSKQLVIKFTDYKHKSHSNVFKLAISPQKGNCCPVSAISLYLKLRGTKPGPLFIFNNTPVLRSMFTSRLQCLLRYLNFNTDLYKSHSFRIGAATTAIANGTPAEQVKVMGRWKSDAYKSYIRVQSLKV